jgi:MCP family monocarboxylic acid transporter-like MFS transporter 10
MLVYFFNAKKVGIAGGLVSCVGLLLSAFIKNMKLYFLTFGLVLGIGQALSVSAFLSILPHYFKKRLGLANGLMTFGGALITIGLPFLVELCLEELGLAYAFYLLACLAFTTALCGFTFIQRLPENKPYKYYKRVQNSFQFKIFKMKSFIIWVIAGFIGFFGYLIPVYTIVRDCTVYFIKKIQNYLSSILNRVIFVCLSFQTITLRLFHRYSVLFLGSVELFSVKLMMFW